MATVSTIRLTVDLLDCAFVDSLDPRFLYRDSPYQIALTVLNGEAGLSTGIKLYDEDGEYLDLAGTVTAADGTATITIDDEINFDGAYTCLICVNGSKSAEFPLEVRAIGSPVPPTGTVLDWNAITSYTDTATKGPIRPGTGITNTVNLDGSNTHSVAYGTTAGTAAQGNDSRLSNARTPTAHAASHATGGTDPVTAADVNPAGTAIAAALGKLVTKEPIDGVAQNIEGTDLLNTALNVRGRGAFSGLWRRKRTHPAVFSFVSWPDGITTVPTWQVGMQGSDRHKEEDAFEIYDQKSGGRGTVFWVSIVDGICRAVVGLISPFIRAPTSGSLALQDNDGTTHATVDTEGVYLNQLTASRPLWLDASKNVTSPAAATFRADIGAAPITPTVNAQVGTTYTLAATDAGAIVTMTNGSANLLTIPTNAAVPLPVGTIVNVLQGGAGITSIEGDTGVTFNGVSGGTGAITARWQGVALLKVATDTWIGSGSIGTVA
jgi:hypothetical protein